MEGEGQPQITGYKIGVAKGHASQGDVQCGKEVEIGVKPVDQAEEDRGDDDSQDGAGPLSEVL